MCHVNHAHARSECYSHGRHGRRDEVECASTAAHRRRGQRARAEPMDAGILPAVVSGIGLAASPV
jgi:hypothetical protein